MQARGSGFDGHIASLREPKGHDPPTSPASDRLVRILPTIKGSPASYQLAPRPKPAVCRLHVFNHFSSCHRQAEAPAITNHRQALVARPSTLGLQRDRRTGEHI